MPDFYPIIYVRGYAMTDGEMVNTVATPYMGFNLGSTKLRQSWDKKIVRYIFESPLVRLMKDYGYQDTYAGGIEHIDTIPERPVVIYRYYENDWQDASKDKQTASRQEIVHYAKGLEALIAEVRDKYCAAHSAPPEGFRVYLVAHSMGGLICRCLLQNEAFSDSAARNVVDKVFTYGTPHNGIDFAGMNVPRWLGLNNIDNFSTKWMRKYLSISKGPKSDANSLDGKFPENRFFSLVGTNSRDYDVAFGLSRLGTGKLGDGLVRIENAYVRGGPRAHVHLSHSGHYGIVNSEEGYQNLTRFLFGDLRFDAMLIIHRLPLTPEIRRLKEQGKQVRGSYFFETSVAPRGSRYFLDQRLVDHESAILRTYEELFGDPVKRRMPRLFSTYLDSTRVPGRKASDSASLGQTGAAGEHDEERSVVLAVDLAIKPTDFEVNGFLFLDRSLPNPKAFSDQLIIEAFFERNEDGAAMVTNILATWESQGPWEPKQGREVVAGPEGSFTVPVPDKGENSFYGEIVLNVHSNPG